MKICLLLQMIFISKSVSDVIYPSTVCVIGDVQANYDQLHDPRTLMGTYTSIDTNGILFDEEMVDVTTPIYVHSQFNGTSFVASEYLFKAKGVGETNGWALSETLPISGSTVYAFLTCFQDSLFDCNYNEFFWGYNKYEYPIQTIKVLGGDCKEEMCFRNLTLRLKSLQDIDPQNIQAGDFSKLDGEFYRQLDDATGRYEWINKRDSSFRWYYRMNDNGYSIMQNWVYSESGIADRVVCAPGSVESPLFCTTYMYAYESYNSQLFGSHMGIPYYAAGNYDPTVWKMGICGNTNAPTTEPTAATNIPSMDPTALSCDYNGTQYYINASVTKTCDFGYSGEDDIGYCLPGGQIGDWEKGCFKISFSDNFIDYSNERWMVYSPDGIPGERVLAIDGSDSIAFKPDYASLVNIIQSREQITWPMRVRAIVEKRTSECNVWGISVGQSFTSRAAYSSKASWNCVGATDYSKQMSLYNRTFRKYDSKCWNDDIDDTMDVIYTIQNNNSVAQGGSVTTSSSDCAAITIQVTDILSQNPWQDAYLWLGSYDRYHDYDGDWDSDNRTVVGRFDWIGYTQFFSDFDDRMQSIWLNENEQSIMNIGDKISSTTGYEFTIPFSIRLGITKPKIDGVFAHYINLGGTEYVSDTADNMVQIVWRDDVKIRLAYTTDAIFQTGYLNPSDCSWNEVDTTFEVKIDVDTEKIKISDTLCNSVLIATHGLTTSQTIVTLGFIDDNGYDVSDSIEWTYIEAYQLPLSYVGDVANQETTSDVINIDDIYDTLSPTPGPSSSPNTGAPTVPECPVGCVRYYPNRCVQCLCQDGKYDLSNCNTEMVCTDEGQAYCDLCDTDTKTCIVGNDVVRDKDNLCQFEECQGNGNSADYICVVTGNVIGMLMVWKML